MKARKYAVTLTGETPLLMHQDNLQWAEAMKKWSKDPANKSESVAGDDRSPAWRWIGNLYVENNIIVMPSDNLMTMLREGGKRCPTGKGQSTFKAQTQSGIMVDQSAWPVCVNNQQISYTPIDNLIGNKNFEDHEYAVSKLGFTLFVKRAKIGMAKHVRVRPRFDTWTCSGSVTVFDDMITTEVLRDIIKFAGFYAGIGDWRPSSPKSPGSFGKFSATINPM